jgi:DNA polymerase-3 subunit delta
LTIVTNGGADPFIRRLPREIIFFLVHGSDEGLIRERSKGIVDALLDGDSDPLRVIRFDGDALAREPGRLAEEADAVPMFGGSRVIWIETQARDLSPALAPLFSAPPRDCAIVVETGLLKKGTALRSAFEKMSNAVSIECYPDDRRSLAALIEAEARHADLRIAPAVRDCLATFLGADRMTTRSEIAKLLLYVAGRSEIAIADVEAIVSDAAPSALDDAVDGAFLGDHAAVEQTTGRYFADGGDAWALLMAAARRAMTLHRLRLEVDHGRPLDSAMQALHLRMSPVRRGALERQVGQWPASKLGRLPDSLRIASGRVRRDAKMAEITAMRALWAIASSARAAVSQA